MLVVVKRSAGLAPVVNLRNRLCSGESTLAMKPRADVPRSQKQWTYVLQNFKRKKKTPKLALNFKYIFQVCGLALILLPPANEVLQR